MKQEPRIGIVGVGRPIMTELSIKEKDKDDSFSESIEVYPYRNPYHNLAMLPSLKGKQFVCKGKHQYHAKDVVENTVTIREWVCECGRKTTD